MAKTNLLFVCPDNAFSSLLAEAYLHKVAGSAVRAFSGGLAPAEEVAPVTKQILFDEGLSEVGLTPKPWDMFALPHAPHPDFIISLSGERLPERGLEWQRSPVCLTWAVNRYGVTPATEIEAQDVFRRIKEAVDNSVLAGQFSREEFSWRAVG